MGIGTATEQDQKNRLLIRVYGDSLGMPREEIGVSYPSSYSELLKAGIEREYPQLRVDLYNRSRGGASLPELKSLCLDDLRYFGSAAGIIILQCGIVDGAPRPIPPSLRLTIGRMPGPARRAVVRFLHHNRARIQRAGLIFRNTKPEPFLKEYGSWLREAATGCDRVYAVNIAPTTAAMNEHSPGLAQAIEQYNVLIADAVEAARNDKVVLIDAFGAISSTEDGVGKYLFAADGHHITPEGHHLYASLLLQQERQRLHNLRTLAGSEAKPVSQVLTAADL